jgi:hypothetical protein
LACYYSQKVVENFKNLDSLENQQILAERRNYSFLPQGKGRAKWSSERNKSETGRRNYSFCLWMLLYDSRLPGKRQPSCSHEESSLRCIASMLRTEEEKHRITWVFDDIVQPPS